MPPVLRNSRAASDVFRPGWLSTLGPTSARRSSQYISDVEHQVLSGNRRAQHLDRGPAARRFEDDRRRRARVARTVRQFPVHLSIVCQPASWWVSPGPRPTDRRTPGAPGHTTGTARTGGRLSQRPASEGGTARNSERCPRIRVPWGHHIPGAEEAESLRAKKREPRRPSLGKRGSL